MDIFYYFRSVEHPNLVQFFGFFRIGLNLHVVSEFMDCGSLHDLICSRNERMSQQSIVDYAKQICRGINFLHSRRYPNPAGIVHGFLSSKNVLLDSFGKVKISDFAISKIKKYRPASLLERINGFSAPEVLAGEGLVILVMFCNAEHTTASDIYSFGMILIHMVIVEVPNGGKTKAELRRIPAQEPNAILLDQYPPIDSNLLSVCIFQ